MVGAGEAHDEDQEDDGGGRRQLEEAAPPESRSATAPAHIGQGT
jgi:hypothetical protein